MFRLLRYKKNTKYYFITSSYKILYAKTKKAKYTKIDTEFLTDAASLTKFQFSTSTQIAYVYVPQILSDLGYYKIQFIVQYKIKGHSIWRNCKTQWVKVRVY